MTDTQLSASDAALDHAHDDHDDHGHPSDADYVKIALLLGFLTLIEVSTYWPFGEIFERSDIGLIGILTVLMILKFVIVVAYFMHLKFDSKVYKWMFTAGLILALGVYFIVFFAENLF